MIAQCPGQIIIMDIIVKRHRFYERCQRNNETFLQFQNDVRQLAKNCEFDSQEEWIVRDRLVFGMKNADLCQKILQNGGNPTLQFVINICGNAEETLEKGDDAEMEETGIISFNI